jgi:hypothetical protein
VRRRHREAGSENLPHSETRGRRGADCCARLKGRGDREGKGREERGRREGKGREEKGREGKRREGKGREEKGREEKRREEKRREQGRREEKGRGETRREKKRSEEEKSCFSPLLNTPLFLSSLCFPFLPFFLR